MDRWLPGKPIGCKETFWQAVGEQGSVGGGLGVVQGPGLIDRCVLETSRLPGQAARVGAGACSSSSGGLAQTVWENC